MKIIFIHRNFPAQFRHLVSKLLENPDNDIFFITNNKKHSQYGVKKIVYEPTRNINPDNHHYLKFNEDCILHGQAVAKVLLELKKHIKPDIIYAHAWGVDMFVKDIFPDTPLVCYYEWFYNSFGSDVDFVSNGKIPVDNQCKIRVKNSPLLISLYSSDYGITPTLWQLKQFPEIFRSKISVIHDGINTDIFCPSLNTKLVIPSKKLDLSDSEEIVTFATRGMEPYRGFPQFMEAAYIIQKRRPKCHIVVAGDDRVCYGSSRSDGRTYKQYMLDKFEFDNSRLHFTGSLPYSEYIRLLQCTNAHVYLTYPFVLSWSVLEAMSCGCPIVASDTPPVKEIIQDRINGFLADFFSPDEIADKIEEVLDNKGDLRDIKQNARNTIIQNYNLSELLPRHIEMLYNIVQNKVMI